MVYNWIELLRPLLYPSCCALCGSGAAQDIDLCPECLRDLPWVRFACPRCGIPMDAGFTGEMCGNCQRSPPAFDATVVPLVYREPADYLLRSLKYGGQAHLARTLGTLLARHGARRAPLPRLLLPVPLHWRRLRERGFNQALEIARAVSRQLNIPVDCRVGQRLRETAPQSLLAAPARRGNLRGAFRARRPLAARHVAIVDDVLTTGHTVNEYARVLRQAGARIIECWVVARTV